MNTPQLLVAVVVMVAASALAACGDQTPTQTTTDTVSAGISPVYNKDTGRLSELLSDRDGDGRNETRAIMDGAALLRIEIDKTRDGVPDRFEYYLPLSAGGTAQRPWLERAEDRHGDAVVRRETYEGGVIARAEEDTDLDGRMDKWETYVKGVLTYLDLDLKGAGKPTSRLEYGLGGSVTSKSDSDGDGIFE